MTEKNIAYCIEQVDKCIESMHGLYPADASENGVYPCVGNSVGWTQGFWVGMLWLAYEFTKDKKYKKLALNHVDDFYNRIKKRIDVNHHDMGFLYLPSCVAAYRLTGSEKAKEAALMAADCLCERFCEKGQFIQAWGEIGAPENYRLIIDCLLNIPLLFWAYDVTGKNNYRRIAMAHLKTAVSVVIRDDGSTFHTFFFDPKTGAPLRGETHQGYSADSIWARGQAWGVYGLAIAYKYTKSREIADMFIKVTDVFINHLPEDNIPAWDMIFTDTKTVKDSSAASIAICGIYEMQKHTEIPQRFSDSAARMLEALGKNLTEDMPQSNGIVKHSTYAMPQKIGVDECNIWGDYYYMEALMRCTDNRWNSYFE